MKKFIYIIIFLGALSITGCQKGFLDINRNPYDVTDPTIGKLLTGLQRRMVTPDGTGNINMGMPAINNWLALKEVDNYSLNRSSVYLTNSWTNLFAGVLPQAEELITRATEQDLMIYAGIAKLYKAYAFMVIVDLWGDVPFDEFFVIGNNEPKPDKSEYIYNEMLELITEARGDLATTTGNLLKPKDDDLIYGGDVEKWTKLANTLELRMLVQSRKGKDQITGWSTRVNALLAENNFIGNDEDFQFPHSTEKDPSDERHQSYVNEYAGGQKTYFISPWFYEIMKGMTLNFPQNPMSGLEDPRIPYYWVNQATATQAASNVTDYRDGAFISIMYNSNSGYQGGSQEGVMTCVGIYPVGGNYDDGRGIKVSETSGTGIAPNKMIQAYSVPFMKAELYLTEGITGDASAAFREGVEKSFYHVNAVSQAAKGSATVPVLDPTVVGDAQTFVNDLVSRFNAATDEKKLEILMTQKWIANFYNSFEAYADIRRTGYPKLMFDVVGETVKSPYKQQVAAEAGVTEYYLKAKAKFPRILEYSTGETSTNPNIVNGRDISVSGHVFWDK